MAVFIASLWLHVWNWPFNPSAFLVSVYYAVKACNLKSLSATKNAQGYQDNLFHLPPDTHKALDNPFNLVFRDRHYFLASILSRTDSPPDASKWEFVRQFVLMSGKISSNNYPFLRDETSHHRVRSWVPSKWPYLQFCGLVLSSLPGNAEYCF